MSEPITNLPDAVAALGALPMPMGPQMPDFPPPPRTFEEKLRADVARLQGLLAEAVADKHRALRERDLIRERVSEPFGCTHCGVEKRSHGRRYLGAVGMHAWERPTDEQVKTRMLARRMARVPLPSHPEIELVLDELTGANLSLYEEELLTARLRLALVSAQRGRRELRVGVAEAKGALVAAVKAAEGSVAELRREHDENARLRERIAELETERERWRQTTYRLAGESGLIPKTSGPQASFADLARQETNPARRQAWRMLAQAEESERSFVALTTPAEAPSLEDPHDGPLAHTYRLGRDLPEMGSV